MTPPLPLSLIPVLHNLALYPLSLVEPWKTKRLLL